jgi:short-subunit dehydrogenase involved in D-alanine esterification of teichoic acids
LQIRAREDLTQRDDKIAKMEKELAVALEQSTNLYAEMRNIVEHDQAEVASLSDSLAEVTHQTLGTH